MGPRYRRVAVIGAGPLGISAVKALHEEKVFDTIRIFERQGRVGGIWHLDQVPDVFPGAKGSPKQQAVPADLPQLSPPSPEDTTVRSGIYEGLDSNVGAEAMSFTHTPFPQINSAASTRIFGRLNPTRPFRVITRYLEDLFRAYHHLASLNTTVVKVEKNDGIWNLTLRRKGHFEGSEPKEYWWQEQFDAVIVASGHYSVPFVPDVPGLDAAFKLHPTRFEHSKSFRHADNYVGKKVVVVGGNVSAADAVSDLYGIVQAPLEISQRTHNEALDSAWNLPNVQRRPGLKSIEGTGQNLAVEYTDGSRTEGVDKIIFATGYRLSYPFLTPDPVTPNNRAAGFYQHVFKIGDPSLALVGQVRGALSFRVYEYQAVAVARYFAGRNNVDLPSPQEQDNWEVERLKYKGNSAVFHEIKPDFAEYFNFLADLAGPAAPDSDAYALPRFDEKWVEQGFKILALKNEWWQSIQNTEKAIVPAKL
ncbi:hypothetical protein N7470_001702 [Penicillium chermesinum]|nr:hypothetical protein N7470_001702 [Penicillium chermesinum]